VEIIELIFGSLQLCECFLSLLSLVSATGGAAEAQRGKANRRERRLAKQAGEKPPPVSRDNWIALILFLCAGALLLIVVISLIASRM
jgi:hypothetical protein